MRGLQLAVHVLERLRETFSLPIHLEPGRPVDQNLITHDCYLTYQNAVYGSELKCSLTKVSVTPQAMLESAAEVDAVRRKRGLAVYGRLGAIKVNGNIHCGAEPCVEIFLLDRLGWLALMSRCDGVSKSGLETAVLASCRTSLRNF